MTHTTSIADLASVADEIPIADIDTSPTFLLASLFSARRSGDDLLARVYLTRLHRLGIRIHFGSGIASGLTADVVTAPGAVGGAR